MAYAPRALTVGVLLLADYRLSTVATFADTLQCATKLLGKGLCRPILMSPAGKPATSTCGRSLMTESAHLWPENFSYLAIIGDYRHRIGMPEHTIQRYIQSADRLDVPLVGIGNGVATLARFGFLDGRVACSAAANLSSWTRQFPGVRFRSGQLIVEDGNRITSLGGAVGGDLAALLLDRHFGKRLARRAVTGILLGPHTSSDCPAAITVRGFTPCGYQGRASNRHNERQRPGSRATGRHCRHGRPVHPPAGQAVHRGDREIRKSGLPGYPD